VADRALSAAIGDSLIALLDWAWPHVEGKVASVTERVADVLRPDPPMTLRTLDGHVLTGVAVMNQGQVIAFLGTRQAVQTSFPSRQQDPYFDDDPDAPLWARRSNPYGR
jgi:hypothetical protein